MKAIRFSHLTDTSIRAVFIGESENSLENPFDSPLQGRYRLPKYWKVTLEGPQALRLYSYPPGSPRGGVAILLEKSFSGRRDGDGVSFDAQRGAVYGRLGHNGAGKTIMDWIPGLKTPDAENRCKECAQTNGLSARSAP